MEKEPNLTSKDFVNLSVKDLIHLYSGSDNVRLQLNQQEILNKITDRHGFGQCASFPEFIGIYREYYHNLDNQDSPFHNMIRAAKIGDLYTLKELEQIASRKNLIIDYADILYSAAITDMLDVVEYLYSKISFNDLQNVASAVANHGCLPFISWLCFNIPNLDYIKIAISSCNHLYLLKYICSHIMFSAQELLDLHLKLAKSATNSGHLELLEYVYPGVVQRLSNGELKEIIEQLTTLAIIGNKPNIIEWLIGQGVTDKNYSIIQTAVHFGNLDILILLRTHFKYPVLLLKQLAIESYNNGYYEVSEYLQEWKISPRSVESSSQSSRSSRSSNSWRNPFRRK